MRHILFSFFLLCAGMASFSANAELKAEHYTLENGMKVVVVERPGTGVVTHMVWMNVGSSVEPEGKSGVAHYLEHMMFKETESLNVNEYSRTIERLGGKNNAFTGRDFTAFYVSIGAQYLPQVMKLEAERMMRLTPSNESFTSEKKVILEERAMRIDNQPSSQLGEAMQSALFYHHPYRIPIIGWQHEIRALTLDDVMTFYHTHYHPANALLLVVGDVKAEKVLEEAKKYYGEWKPADDVLPAPLQEPPHLAATTLTLHHPGVKQKQWVMAYVTPSLGLGDQSLIFPMMVFSGVLGQGKNSLLYQEMGVKERMLVDIGTDYESFSKGPGLFTVYAVPQETASLKTFKTRYRQMVHKVAMEGVPAEELERVKNSLKAEAIYARDGNAAIAFPFGELLMLGKDETYFNDWDDTIGKVTNEDVKRAAQFIDQLPSPVTGILLPEKKS